MSLFDTPRCIPSTVLGLYRFLMAQTDQKAAREDLERYLMPEGALGEDGSRNGLMETIRGAKNIGLVEEEAKIVSLAPGLPASMRDAERGEAILPVVLTDLLCDSDDDLAGALAWFLSRDAFGGDGTESTVHDEVSRLKLKQQTKLTNSDRFKLLVYWSTYLGFCWTHARESEMVVVPDPTAHLRRRLPVLIENTGQILPLHDFMGLLSQSCPLFEGGTIRSRGSESLEAGTLSSSTALALLRLHDEGTVELIHRQDSRSLALLPDGDGVRRLSHIRYVPHAS